MANKVDKRAMELYLGGKGTLAEAYEQAKLESVEDLPEGFEKLFGKGKGGKK